MSPQSTPVHRTGATPDGKAVTEVAALIQLQDHTPLINVLGALPQQYRCYDRSQNGRHRTICEPSEDLKGIQARILRLVLSRFIQHPANHCRPQRSIITNARVHLNSDYVSVCDLARCFPSVTHAQVRDALERNGIQNSIVDMMTALCTLRGELPQGAPTSTAILNAVLYPLDEELALAAVRRGLIYTRYVDDLTVSGRHSPRSFVRRTVTRIATNQGFTLAPGKTRHWEPPDRATVTGVLLTSEPTAGRKVIREVERAIAELRKGVPATEQQIAHIRGQIAWIGSLRSQKGAALQRDLHKAQRQRRAAV